MTYKKTPKNPLTFECNCCHYYTSNKKDFNKHNLTNKHKILTEYLQNGTNIPQNKFFDCECGNKYKHRQSLNNHKKCCKLNNTNVVESYCENSLMNDKQLIIKLLNQNNELQNQLIELSKEQKSYSINNKNGNINSNNKTFNLNLFLNEQCKDAMNITDFVDSLHLQLSDLENVGKIGFVEGISDIIVKNLKAMDVHKRPVHCSDSKREVMYVKDENKWEKENDENKKLRKAIKYIANKNTKLLPKFKEKYPDCGKSESKYSEQYNKLIVEAMGGRGDNETEKENRIIRNIAKEVTIDKNITIS